MRFLFVGDTHSHKDLDKLRSPKVSQLGLGRRDALIHLGDMGAPWRADWDQVLAWWQELPMKVIVCLGNHENYGWIMRQPLIRRFGCRGFDLGGNIFAPLPGETATLGGKRFWFYPGGLSIDFFWRQLGVDVFPEELLTKPRAEEIIADYFKHRTPDYLISHDGPRSFVEAQFGFSLRVPPESYYEHMKTAPHSRAHPAFMLDRIYAQGRYKKWFFGHHHQDVSVGGLSCLFHQMVLEDSLSGESRVILP